MEKLWTWTRHPLPCTCCLCIGRDGPSSNEGPEMIQPNTIHVSKESAQTIYKKSEPGAAECIPIIDGVAPQLSVLTEIVRGHSGDKSRTEFFVKQEQFRVRPHIA